jgi:hypothetical protein
MKNKPKIQLPSRIKQSQQGTEHVTPAVAQADAQSDASERMAARQKPQTDEGKIFALAKQWAELHAKPKQRDKMDDLLVGLPEETQRKVYLLGQRLAAGLPYKLAE